MTNITRIPTQRLYSLIEQLTTEETSTVKTLVPDGNNGLEWVDGSSGSITDSTGVKTGGVITIGAGAGEYSISDGTGQVVDNTGTVTTVSWSGKINITPINIGSTLRTYIGIDSTGAVVEQPGEFTITQGRSIIVLGLVVHVDGVTIFVVNNRQHIAYNALSSLYDLGEAIGVFNIIGNIYSGNSGGNLSIDKSEGRVFRMGSNYITDPNNPHEITLSVLILASFSYVFNDNSNSSLLTLIDPSSLDDGAGGLTPLSNNTKWSCQRIYSFTSNVIAIQRGVEEYNTLEEAITGKEGEEYFTASSLLANGLFRGWLCINKIATDLTDPLQARFISAQKFAEA